ncbi:MAG: hypothetical protein FWD38_09570 [Oscillospiraceae bacterium]|nr:hypothetical protein [Oscillospiraceae bacterium]
MNYNQMKQEKDARYEVYCNTYAEQLRLLGYISSLEKDNENIKNANIVTNRDKRRAKKLTKINNKDIKKYNKALSQMPPVPEFK